MSSVPVQAIDSTAVAINASTHLVGRLSRWKNEYDPEIFPSWSSRGEADREFPDCERMRRAQARQ